MKKAICLFICVAMIMTSATNLACAYENTSDSIDAKLEEYTITKEYSGIYTDNHANYLYVDNESDSGIALIPMQKISVSSEAQIASIAEDENLPEEVQEGLHKALQSAKVSNASVTLFVPDDKATTYSSTSSEWTYGTYNGVAMKNYLVYTTEGSTAYQYVKQGVDTAAVADLMNSIFLELAGSTQLTLPFLTSAVSLLDAFQNAFNTEIQVSSSDYLQLNLSYNGVAKYTYAQQGSVWKFGLLSRQVTVTRVYTCQYYANTGNPPYHKSFSVNKTASSGNFASPYPMAYACAIAETPRTESAKWTAFYTKDKKQIKLATFSFS